MRSGMEILVILSAIILTTGAKTENIVFIESLSNLKHDVKGKLFAIGSSQLLLTQFSYDGQGPDAFFMVGTSGTPGESGIILPYPADGKTYEYYDQNAPVLTHVFDNEEVLLDLPQNINVEDIEWFSVWCRKFSVDFGSIQKISEIDLSLQETFEPELEPELDVVFIDFLSELKHNVKGKLSAIGSSKLLLTDFSYDGQGPDAFFMIGTSGTPGESGIILPYPADGKTYQYYDQNAPILTQVFDNEDVILDLPEDINVSDVAWFSVWCRKYSVNFGSIQILEEVEVEPEPEVEPEQEVDQKDTESVQLGNTVFMGSFSELLHDVKGKLSALSTSQLLLTDFSYDGQGPDAFFMVGTSGTPGESGIILPYPADGKTYQYYDQNAPVLQSFDNERLVLDLPDNVSVSDVTWISVWCRQFSINFGSVTVPSGIDFSSLEAVSKTSKTQTTRWPPAIVSTTTTRSPIIVDTNVNVEWEQVGACFSFMKKRSWEIVPGILEGFSAQVLLPYLGRRVTMMVAGMTTMVAAYANNGDYLGKLNSDDGKSWTLDLEGNQDPELILLFTVRTGNSWSNIRGLEIDGRNIDLCEEEHEGEGIGERSNPWNPILVTERKAGELPSCVEVDMAVYGHNAAVEQNVASAVDCWELCQVYPSCRFWNYNKFSPDTVAWSGNKGRCHIKTQKGENPGTKSGYTFGSRDCRPE